jgi:hypothetical protein
VILAQASGESLFVDALLRYGPLGIILVAAALGFIYFKPAVDDLRRELADSKEERRQLLAEVKRLNELSREIVMPAVTQSTDLIRRITERQWREREQGGGQGRGEAANG